jgi:hypothetical protein
MQRRRDTEGYFLLFFRVHEIKTLRLSGFAFEINANLGKKNISFIEGKNI